MRLRLRLRPGPGWGSLQRSSSPLAGLNGLTSKGRRRDRGGKGGRGKCLTSAGMIKGAA